MSGSSGFQGVRIPLLIVKAVARVSCSVRFRARSLLLRATKPVRESARYYLTCVR